MVWDKALEWRAVFGKTQHWISTETKKSIHICVTRSKGANFILVYVLYQKRELLIDSCTILLMHPPTVIFRGVGTMNPFFPASFSNHGARCACCEDVLMVGLALCRRMKRSKGIFLCALTCVRTEYSGRFHCRIFWNESLIDKNFLRFCCGALQILCWRDWTIKWICNGPIAKTESMSSKVWAGM